ncbi:MAG: sulfatase-like hydrolase/transferase [bacterium]|nr:sulfatase-like hydrolase/transferase [bacterium]
MRVTAKRWVWLLAMALLSTSFGFDAAGSTSNEPPNFLIIFIDDLGIDQLSIYDDVNYYDSPYPYANTPTIDDLARTGVRFRQARAYPTCSPSRAALQSGQYGRRTGCTTVVNGPAQGAECTNPELGAADPGCIPPTYEYSIPPNDVVTLAELCGSFEYDTGFFGKSHLQIDAVDSTVPTDDAYPVSFLGYDAFYGVPRNPNQGPYTGIDTSNMIGAGFYNYHWIEADLNGLISSGWSTTTPDGYLTKRQQEATLNWINGRTRPFLAVWNTSDIHGPLEWPPSQGHGFGPELPEFEFHFNTRGRAKLEYLDTAIAWLLSGMSADVLENTTIILMGDNGTSGKLFSTRADEVRYPDGHPLHQPHDDLVTFSAKPYDPRRAKGTAYEAGVRVPLIITGANVPFEAETTPEHRTSDALVDVVDIFETIEEMLSPATYVADPTRRSFSLATIMADPLGAAASPDNHGRQFSHAERVAPNSFGPTTIFSESSYYIRRDRFGNLWKLIREREYGASFGHEFYNLKDDPRELNDLGITHPEFADTLAALDNL